MRKFLRPQDILLLGLARVLDIAEEIRDPLGIMSLSYKSMYGWVPDKYKRNNFYQLVSRSLKAQLIEKIEKDGKIYMRITSGGMKTIKRDFPMILFQDKPWDRKWRIVMFDVEEVHKSARERLRNKLKELGFGMLQKSVFITPHNIVEDFLEFSEAWGLKDYLYVLETEKIFFGEKTEFVNKIWKLDNLNESYKEIIDEIKNRYMISYSDRKEKSYIQSDKERRDKKSFVLSIRAKWLNAITRDPFLPRELLPKPWWVYEAERLIKSLKA